MTILSRASILQARAYDYIWIQINELFQNYKSQEVGLNDFGNGSVHV